MFRFSNVPNCASPDFDIVAVTSQPGDRDTFSLRNMQHRDREGKVISTFNMLDPAR